MSPWQIIPQGFEPLIRDHILRTRGEDRERLTAFDFPSGQAVRIRFPDGSFVYFEYAFFIEDPSRNRVAVFTEHCGYYVFPLSGLSIATFRAVDQGIASKAPPKTESGGEM